MSDVGYEPTITASERAKTVHTSDHSVTVTDEAAHTDLQIFKINVGSNVDIGHVPVGLDSAARRKRLMWVLPAP
jgi:hypothetical protein